MKKAKTVGMGMLAMLGLAACDMEQQSATGPDVVPSFAKKTGFETSAPLQAAFGPGYGGTMKALATVDDMLPGGEQLAGTLDGIGIWGGQSKLNLMVTHELSVGFEPASNAVRGSRVSHMTIDTRSLTILDHHYPVDGTELYNRFCSAEWVDAGDGFPGGYFFAGEEFDDGLQVAIDQQGRVTEMPHIGKYAHENQISVPGFPGHVVVLNFDDDGGSGVGGEGSESELYMYVARNANQVLRGQGQLYVFKADDPALLPNDISVGGSIDGFWVPVPESVALDFLALEQFADDEEVFPFIRLEDGFYDKRPGASPGAFFYDTGRGSITDPDDGSVIDPWGSIYHLSFNDPSDPAGGSATLTLLDRSEGPDLGWASPDNGDMNASGEIMLQEDRANGPWNREPRIWRFQLAGSTLSLGSAERVVDIVNPDDIGGTSVYGWESSGIVDASEWFGEGAWIFDVQAHSVAAQSSRGDGGQLIYMKLDN
jgi:hypothetical protein